MTTSTAKADVLNDDDDIDTDDSTYLRLSISFSIATFC